MGRAVAADTNDRPAGLLLHPVMVAALVGLVVNDHLLKARWPGPLTGKLSDVAGLALFPALVVGVIEVVAWSARKERPCRGRLTVAAGAATAVAFAAVQLVEPVTDAYRWIAGLPWGRAGSVVGDPTDLLVLPAVVVPWLVVTWSDRSSGGAASADGRADQPPGLAA